jgi:hypothetical protein
MNLREILGGTRRIISEDTVVFESVNGTHPMTPLEQKMYTILLELTGNGSSHTLTHHGSD